MSMPRQRIAALLLVLLLLPSSLAGCRQSSHVAIVNGQPIERSDFERRVQIAQTLLENEQAIEWDSADGRETLAKLQETILEDMIDELLIEQAVEEAGLAVDPEDVDQMLKERDEQLRTAGYPDLSTFLAQIGMSLEEYRARLTRTRQRELATNQLVPLPETLPQAHLRHILLLLPEDAATAQERIEQGEDWATVAEDISTDRTSPGGDLGWLPVELLPPELGQAATEMAPGEVRQVQTEYGYHVVELLGYQDSPIRQEILDNSTLVALLKENRFDDWLARQRAAAQIERLAYEG